jgi:hypothetical protein
MADLVTVFRSADANAEDDAKLLVKMLAGEGIAAKVFDDSAPGVPEGAWEVRVAPADSARAEALVDASPAEDEIEVPDQSHDLDMISVFSSGDGSTEGFEAQAVKNLLEASGVHAIVVNESQLLGLSLQVQVAREHVTQAKRLIADAISAGPAAADEAERQSEEPGSQS